MVEPPDPNDRARVPAELTWVATPALGNTAMLQGAIRNTTGQPILEGAASLFLDEKISALPLISEKELVGVITTTDLLRTCRDAGPRENAELRDVTERLCMRCTGLR